MYQDISSKVLPTANKQRKNDFSAIPAPLLPVAGQKDACFKSACLLAHQIDCDLDAGRYHYRNRAGELLTTLDQIVAAILSNNLLEPEG